MATNDRPTETVRQNASDQLIVSGILGTDTPTDELTLDQRLQVAGVLEARIEERRRDGAVEFELMRLWHRMVPTTLKPTA